MSTVASMQTGRLDARALFRQMARIRHFERAAAGLWREGLIGGEMHLGIGEEAIAAGVVAHLRDGDGLAVDHRSTPPLVARGVDLEAMLLEMLGSEDGLCRGRGGHMHMLSAEHLAASSGIVGAGAPLACGFALAAQRLRPGAVGVGFFGEGAMNQGMLLEALNLAQAWRLPVVFVCKDNRWAITTRSRAVTGGDLAARACAFGMPARRVDGLDVRAVFGAAGELVGRARRGRGPGFLLARCARPDGHFLGDPVLRVLDAPLREGRELAGPLLEAVRAQPGAPGRQRAAALARVGGVLAAAAAERRPRRGDALRRARRLLSSADAAAIEREAVAEVRAAVARALERRDGRAVGAGA
jgi:acetoin:2,6-dichlorophenolindophenol oxidoreductase subunit alpha